MLVTSNEFPAARLTADRTVRVDSSRGYIGARDGLRVAFTDINSALRQLRLARGFSA